MKIIYIHRENRPLEIKKNRDLDIQLSYIFFICRSNVSAYWQQRSIPNHK